MKRRDYVSREIALDERNDKTISEMFDTMIELAESELPTKTEETGIPETKTGEVDGALNVRLRNKPNTHPSSVMCVLGKGTRVEIFGEEGEFYKVRPLISFKTKGYVAKKFIKIIE